MSSKNDNEAILGETNLAKWFNVNKIAAPDEPWPTSDEIEQYASDVIDHYRYCMKLVEDGAELFKNTSLINRIRNKCVEVMINETMDFLAAASTERNIMSHTIALAAEFPIDEVTTYSLGMNKIEFNTFDEVNALLGQIETVLDFDKPGDRRRKEIIKEPDWRLMEPVEVKIKPDDVSPAFVLQPEQIVISNIPTKIRVVFTATL